MTSIQNLREVAALFFKLGCIAFGGPAAHIAMMEDEVVQKRKWMTEQHFLDLIGATHLIPGPNSTEMTMHCGYERAGWKGLFAAGICFIFPAVMITGAFAWAYTRYGQLPEVEAFIYGIKPAVIAIILLAAFRLGKKAVKNNLLIILGLGTLVACLFGVNKMLALLGCGLAGVIWYFIIKNKNNPNVFAPILLFQLAPEIKISTLNIFFSFLKVGAILYGSGYVLFAYLDSELVANGWLTRPELLDAIAVGQITPGPVLSTATFIGWQMGGWQGALAATVGIFLPSFLFVYILNPIIPKLRQSKIISAFLDAVNVAAVALIVAVCMEMGQEILTDWRSILIAVVSILLVFRFQKINPVWIVMGGAVLGYLLRIL